MDNSVSVIIPTWNRVKLLDRAIRSCLAQTVPILEILVCDDGSTDGTEDMVKSFDSSRVKWCPGDHGGRPAIPRNRGIRKSMGRWIAFLDDDDEWLPEKVEKQLDLAEKLACSAVSSNAYRLLPGDELSGLLLSFDEQKISFSELVRLNQVICSSAMVKRDLFNVVGTFPEQSELIVGEDYALWLRIATQTEFAFEKSPLVRYFDDPNNSIRRDGDDFVQTCNVLEDFLHWSAPIASLKPCSGVVKARLSELQKTSLKGCKKSWLSSLFGGSRS